jgi:hypothetical protein
MKKKTSNLENQQTIPAETEPANKANTFKMLQRSIRPKSISSLNTVKKPSDPYSTQGFINFSKSFKNFDKAKMQIFTSEFKDECSSDQFDLEVELGGLELKEGSFAKFVVDNRGKGAQRKIRVLKKV